MTYMISTTTTT